MGVSIPDFGAAHWRELPENPLISYSDDPNEAIGDPQVLLPGEHDELWHMFFHGYLGHQSGCYDAFFHYTSPDGVRWGRVNLWERWGVGQNSMFRHGDRWVMYFTHHSPEIRARGFNSVVSAKTTRDFVHWSDEIELIAPETPLEREGRNLESRNPCMVRLPNGRYRLYYSAGTVYLEDCGYCEPKYIFCAESDSPLGPFERIGGPLIAPEAALPFRNHGAGAIKVYGWGDGYLAFYNPIYIDAHGASRSEIRLLASDDGLAWTEAPCNPVIVPAGDGWRSAIVYQLDAVCWGGQIRMYFNARDAWRGGVERIGCCVMDLPGGQRLRKLM